MSVEKIVAPKVTFSEELRAKLTKIATEASDADS
jgi:hypothetical protein